MAVAKAEEMEATSDETAAGTSDANPIALVGRPNAVAGSMATADDTDESRLLRELESEPVAVTRADEMEAISDETPAGMADANPIALAGLLDVKPEMNEVMKDTGEKFDAAGCVAATAPAKLPDIVSSDIRKTLNE